MPSPHALRPAARLRKRGEIRAAEQWGRRVESNHFLACVLPSVASGSRLAVTASRRVGNAVVRNRLKRLVREGFRRNRDLMKEPMDVVIIARPAAAALKSAQAQEELRSLFLRVGRAG